MERAICERCGERQPRDWSPGHLCIACGAAVRAEVRCAWCAGWTPAVRYCRACGCEVVAPAHYGAARMLKNAGIDRFSLIQRLRELDPEQVLDLTRIYNGQLAVMMRRVDEAVLCETHLLQRGFSQSLEEALVPMLPLEPDRLAAYAADPETTPGSETEALIRIAERSPVSFTRKLSAVALLRTAAWRGAFALASQALESDDAALALEAALAFAHWRVRLDLSDLKLDRWRLAVTAGAVPYGSRLRPWAAAAVALAWFGPYGVVPESGDEPRRRPSGAPRDETPPDWIRTELRAGLDARDPDLRFACAMALGDDDSVVPLLASRDADQRVVARRYLVARNSPAIGPVLLDSPEDVRREIIDGLSSPLPPGLVEPVLATALHPDRPMRAACVRLLVPTLNEEIVGRLLRAVRVEDDPETFRILLTADRLPNARKVIRAILKAGSPRMDEAARHIDFADGELLRLAEKQGPAGIVNLVSVAEVRIAKEPAGESGQLRDAGRFLARIAFGDFPGEARERAFSRLLYGGVWDLFSGAGIDEVFGGRKRFTDAIMGALGLPEPGELLRRILEQLNERWRDVAPAFAENREIVKHFAGKLAAMAGGQSESVPCREEAAKLLIAAAVAHPKAVLPVIAELLRERGTRYELRDVPGWLLAGYDAIGLDSARAEAACLANALAGMHAETAGSGSSPAAMELLLKLARDHPAVRVLVPAGMAEEDADVPRDPEPEPVQQVSTGVDHLVLLPSEPVKTLAEYVALMRALAASRDPQALMAAHGMNQGSFVACVSHWSELLAGDSGLALRYAELLRQEVST